MFGKIPVPTIELPKRRFQTFLYISLPEKLIGKSNRPQKMCLIRTEILTQKWGKSVIVFILLFASLVTNGFRPNFGDMGAKIFFSTIKSTKNGNVYKTMLPRVSNTTYIREVYLYNKRVNGVLEHGWGRGDVLKTTDKIVKILCKNRNKWENICSIHIC